MADPITTLDRFQGSLIGLAVGDAVGTTVEFQPRGSFPLVTDMVGGGPFRLQPGQWTDDTSMALCLATSLLECGGFDPVDQMQRYCRWAEEGYLSSTGHCFDIGNTVSRALRQFRQTGEPFSGPTHPQSAGNGCLMRLAPVPMFYFPDVAQMVGFSGESARTTHGAQECVEASRLFGAMVGRALAGASRAAILSGYDDLNLATDTLQSIAAGHYQTLERDQIRGSGYVVESLAAALWCFWTTHTYADAILAATNLGDDADTTAAICGQLAGAHYGLSGIPQPWRERLTDYDTILALATRLHQAQPQAQSALE
ncbi:ADP-ribosylglycohydrolase [Leptolyngbya sp. BL0902]|uniref:ADP-ribosylglycohydrolase family protein n=1 Tax=Leptolyngbya sp. BL0902 TaxID=1115757 RepID=UPI001938671F|nr:ADP-ribosylglycohydrolase family protein [Leptolyngbya sp. BL0902]QQE64878.1 ADP-ribosylglycohydrolase [Leptolyngbya sp. BL0902]